MNQLKEVISNKKAKIGVVGMGYVGLPLAVLFAKKGFVVTGFDIDAKLVTSMSKGKNHIKDVENNVFQELVKSKNLLFTANFDDYKNVDVIVICVPTPLDKHKVPSLDYVISSTKEISKRLNDKKLIVLESTTYPGTTDELLLPILEKDNKKVNKDFYLAFSPERIDPGNKNFTLEQIVKVVGGVGHDSLELTKTLYQQAFEKVFPVSTPRAAEMTKLLENIFRSVNIAMINEMALLCGRLNIDIWEVIDAAATKPYGFMPFYPGPGVGGHCIPLDPFYLSWKAKECNFYSRFIELAGEVNDQMPHYIVSKINSALNSHKKSINGSKIFVIGVSYKKDIGDLRESPCLEIIKELLSKKGLVEYHDPYISSLIDEGIGIDSVEFSDKKLSGADVVVVLTNHSSVDCKKILQKAKLIVDTRNCIKDRSSKNIFRL